MYALPHTPMGRRSLWLLIPVLLYVVLRPVNKTLSLKFMCKVYLIMRQTISIVHGTARPT